MPLRLERKIMTRTAMKIVIFAGLMFAPTCAYAQNSIDERVFSTKTGERVNQSLEVMMSNQHSEALASLKGIIQTPGLNAYEKSTVYQMMGATHYELGQGVQSITAFENAISSGGLLPVEVTSLNLNIAQLLIGQGEFKAGAERMETWDNNGGELSRSHVEMLTQAWVQAEDYDRAVPWAERWFDTASPKERKHYDLLNFLYAQLDMTDKRADIVKQIEQRFPQ